MKPRQLGAYLITIIGLTGCQSVKGPPPEFQQEIAGYLETKPAPFKGMHESLYIEGERNSVLNFNRLGWLNLIYGDFDEAEWAFDQSLARIETIYANDPKAEEAKSKFSEESVKDFKGEPYERAMAYYYRGILYLIKGDYENARASFKMGEFQDTLSSKEQFQSDFALLNYLQGWASACNGDNELADEAFNFAYEYNSALSHPDSQHRLLILLDTGTSPVKQATGKYGEILQFIQGKVDSNTQPVFYLQYVQSAKPHPSADTLDSGHNSGAGQREPVQGESVQVQDDILFFTDEIILDEGQAEPGIVEIAHVDKNSVSVATDITANKIYSDAAPVIDIAEFLPIQENTEETTAGAYQKKTVVTTLDAVSAVDVFNQATTRGGRPIQGILDGKAQFKSTTETIGAVSSTLGALTTVASFAGGSNIGTGVGLGLQVAGLVSTVVSKATTPQADTRYWDTLPNAVYLATTTRPEGRYLLKIGNKESDSVVPGIYGNILGGDEKCSIFWATSINPISLPNSSPHARLSWAEMADKDDEDAQQDDVFRKSLTSHSPGGF